MVSSGRRSGRRNSGSGGRLSARALALTTGGTIALEETVEGGWECDGSSGPMAPMGRADGARLQGKSGERGRCDRLAGFGSVASATRDWAQKLKEASGQLVGCPVEFDAQLARGEGGERQEVGAAGDGVDAVVHAQAAKAEGGGALVKDGPMEASSMAERPRREGTDDGAGTTEVVNEGGPFGGNEGDGVDEASGAAVKLRAHGGLKAVGRATEASAGVETPMAGGAGAASGAAELGTETEMEKGGDEGVEVSKYMHGEGAERREGGGRPADDLEYYTHGEEERRDGGFSSEAIMPALCASEGGHTSVCARGGVAILRYAPKGATEHVRKGGCYYGTRRGGAEGLHGSILRKRGRPYFGMRKGGGGREFGRHKGCCRAGAQGGGCYCGTGPRGTEGDNGRIRRRRGWP